MTRKLKALGLASIAVLAMSAVVASAAQATAGTLTAESYTTTLTETQVGTNQWTIGTGVRVVTCASSLTHGSLAGPAGAVTLRSTYTNCTSTGGLPVTITNSCDYITSWTKVTATTGTEKIDISCPAGKAIVIDVYASAAKHTENVRACEYTIEEQKGLVAGEYHMEGVGTGRDLTTTLNVQKIVTKNAVGSKLLCGIAAGETGTSTITGTETLKGENPITFLPVGIFIS